MNKEALFNLLESKVEAYNRVDFIENDPIQIPHQFTKKQDIEIMGFFASVLAWGQRVTIINKCKELVRLFDGAPHDFIKNHKEQDLKRFLEFKHRTFNPTDLLYFIHFLNHHYRSHDSLEDAFIRTNNTEKITAKDSLVGFQKYFSSLESFPQRTSKHIATPARNSSCKRLNMFLRWMVRADNKGVDFGLWSKLRPADLLIPLDVHVDRVARKYGLIERKQRDFKTVVELTEGLKQFDPNDPVKYDFALFGMGVMEKSI